MLASMVPICCMALRGQPTMRLAQGADDHVASRLAPYDLQLAVFPDAGGRGIATTRDRSAGETIIEVCDEHIFSTHRLLPSWPILMAAVECEAAAGRPLGDEHILPLLLLLSRSAGESDPWSHFIDSLPQPHQPSPLHASAADLALLPTCYAALASSVDAYARSLHAECAPLLTALATSGMGAPSVCSADAFIWAHGHVNARKLAFGGEPSACVVDDGRPVGALIPVLDLINYWQTVERGDGKWRLVAGGAYKAGEQIVIDYEVRGNLRTWLQFGFALDGGAALAAYDIAELTAAVSRTYAGAYAGAEELEVAVHAWRRWLGAAFHPCLLADEEGSGAPPMPPATVPTPSEWQRDHLFVLDLATSHASDKLNEALIAAVGIVGAEKEVAKGAGGVASHNAATDAILAQLLRGRIRLLAAKLDDCTRMVDKAPSQEAAARVQPLRMLMAAEEAEARRLIAALDEVYRDCVD